MVYFCVFLNKTQVVNNINCRFILSQAPLASLSTTHICNLLLHYTCVTCIYVSHPYIHPTHPTILANQVTYRQDGTTRPAFQ